MTIEIEAKMRVDDRAALEERLAKAGARAGPVIHETNTFFDTAKGTLKRSDQGLRIRVEVTGDNKRTVTITHKGPRDQGRIKRRMETELIVNDDRTASEMLTALGYAVVLSFEKTRRRWELDGCHVDLDTLPYLGDFVEIEGPDDQAVLAVREKLGMGASPLIRASYISILIDYLTQHHIESQHVKFDDAK
ncbi:MAG: class IV adenylate cyclase [Planctomycetes bacterium]|nr:class IV adenylate cyclase [Planctomycetota bacterium]